MPSTRLPRVRCPGSSSRAQMVVPDSRVRPTRPLSQQPSAELAATELAPRRCASPSRREAPRCLRLVSTVTTSLDTRLVLGLSHPQGFHGPEVAGPRAVPPGSA